MSITPRSLYDPATGLFTGQVLYGQLVGPAGLAEIDGAYDHLSQRVDIEADPPAVIDYVPDAPADTDLATWAWDAGTRRWVSTPTLLANKLAAKAEVQAQIDALEADDSHQRSLREIVLALQAATTPPSESVAELTALDDAIAVLRAQIEAIDAAATQGELDAAVAP